MNCPHQRCTKILRSSWKAKFILLLLLLGVAALFWLRVALIGDVLLTSILVSPLIALFGWLLKQHLETKIILDDTQIVYQKGRIKKIARCADIQEIRFREVNGFDSASTCWVFLLFLQPMQQRDEESFHSFSAWLGVTEPEKTLTLELSLFERETVAEFLTSLAATAPQATYDQNAAALI